MKSVIFLILTMLSCSASAAWTQFSETNERVYFVDLDTLKKEGTTRIFWRLTNYKTRNKFGDLSGRRKELLDCTKEATQTLSFASFSEPFAGGMSTSTLNPAPEWNHIPPNTVDDTLMRLVCSR
jgi:hypothetical protein